MVLWILGAFWTSPFFGIEAIIGLIPIHLHFQKLRGRLQLRAHTLPSNYILQLLLKSWPNIHKNYHCLLLDSLTKHQHEMIKGSIVNMDDRFNEVFPSFDPHNSEFSPGTRIINTFSSHFSFYSFNKWSSNCLLSHLHQLDNLTIVSSKKLSYALIVTNASIRNNVATSIAHIHICNRPVFKTLHHTVNVTSTEAELFAIRCGINQASNS